MASVSSMLTTVASIRALVIQVIDIERTRQSNRAVIIDATVLGVVEVEITNGVASIIILLAQYLLDVKNT